MNLLTRNLSCLSMLMALSGCGNDFNKEIEQWNAKFSMYQANCQSGNNESCQAACQITQEMALCQKMGLNIDPDNQKQVTWLKQCPQYMAALGESVCNKVAPTPLAPPPVPENVAPAPPPVEVENPQGVVPIEPSAVSNKAVSKQQRGAPSVRSDTTVTIKGALSKETVRRIADRHLNEVKFCYERALDKKPALKGRVAIKFIISGTGSVQMAAVASSTLGEPSAENCIAEAVRRWTFPQPDGGGIVIVTYPFLLSTKV